MDAGVRQRLIEEAAEARRNARVPNSGFRVGAAVLTDDGSIVTGCNVELKNMLSSICAERCAVTKAISLGHTVIRAVAVVSDAAVPVSPCGVCRQFLIDFGADIPVVMASADGAKVVQMTTGQLSPMAFLAEELDLREE